MNKRLKNIESNSDGWRFALFYFLSFAAVSLYGTYGSLYFRRRGVSDVQLGLLFSIPAWIGIFAPMVWGVISDALHQRKLPSLIMHLMTAAVFPLFWYWDGGNFWLLCLWMGIFTFVFSAGIPVTDAWVLDHLSHRGGDYGKIRSWGSFGFAMSLLASIFLLKKAKMSTAQDLLPVFLGFCSLRIISGLYALSLPDYHTRGKRPKLDWKDLEVYLHPFPLIFFLAVFMSRFLFSPYYTFFTIYLDEMGIPDNFKGLFWVVAVGFETGLIAISGSLLKRFGPVKLLLAGLWAMAFRMFIFSVNPCWHIILATQCLHALTFGAFHVGSIQIINKITPQQFRASGQTFNGALQGIGSVIGGILGGAISEKYSLIEMFRIFAILAAAITAIINLLFYIWGEKSISQTINKSKN